MKSTSIFRPSDDNEQSYTPHDKVLTWQLVEKINGTMESHGFKLIDSRHAKYRKCLELYYEPDIMIIVRPYDVGVITPQHVEDVHLDKLPELMQKLYPLKEESSNHVHS